MEVQRWMDIEVGAERLRYGQIVWRNDMDIKYLNTEIAGDTREWNRKTFYSDPVYVG